MAELLHFAYHHHPSFVFMTDDDGTERFINDVYMQSMDIARSLVYSDLKDVILFHRKYTKTGYRASRDDDYGWSRVYGLS